MTTQDAIGRALKSEMAIANFTINDLHNISGLSHSHIHGVINANQNTSIKSLDKLCEGLKIDFFTLMNTAKMLKDRELKN
jgi:transcriptional regulator with XRE-family HTH domain